MAGAAAVIISSTRAAAGVYPDRTGPVIAEWLRDKGFEVPDRSSSRIPTSRPAGRRLARLGADLVITSGGTGLSPTDRTPEATRAVLDFEIPGLAEAIRRRGVDAVPTAVLSRGLVGVAGRTLMVNLPGSTGGVRDGLAVLDGVLGHALDQIAGRDHPRHDGETVTAATDLEAGMGGRVTIASVTDEPLDLAAHLDAAADDHAGAMVSFAGVVRDHDAGRAVSGLEYHAHPSAAEVVAAVAAEIADREGVLAVAVSHRIGMLAIGDVALAAAVSAAHRPRPSRPAPIWSIG